MLQVDVRTNPVQTVAAHWDSVPDCPVQTDLQETVRQKDKETDRPVADRDEGGVSDGVLDKVLNWFVPVHTTQT